MVTSKLINDRLLCMQLGGPTWYVELGRRDGTTASLDDANNDLPAPTLDLGDLIKAFSKKGLSANDMIALSGGHTIGQARCSTVSPRLYDFAGHKGASDPALDGNYTATLRGQCKPGDNATLVDLDPTTPAIFDADYYALVAGKRGLLSTDAALLQYPATRDYVERQASAASPDEFFADFAESFVAMSRLDVLTHHKGEIRKVCSKVNPPSDSPPVVVPSPSSSADARSYQLAAATGGLALALATALVL